MAEYGSEGTSKALIAYSSDVTGGFQRDVNGRSGDVNKVGALATLGLQSCPNLRHQSRG
jgi:hypothetical protein